MSSGGPTATLLHGCWPKAVEQPAGLRQTDIGYEQF